MMPFWASGSWASVASAIELFGSISNMFPCSNKRNGFGEGAIPPSSVAKNPNSSVPFSGNLIFWVSSPAGSPKKRTSISSPNLPPAG